MKSYLLKGLVFGCCLFGQAEALSPPKPIQGSARILSKQFSTSSGPYTITFSFPSGWGIGEMISSGGSGHFLLFPEKGGNGCSVEISLFDDEDCARNALNGLKSTFAKVKEVNDGFEVDLQKASYSCKMSGRHIIQIWYSVPKKSKGHEIIWSALKNSVTISGGQAEKPQEYVPVSEAPHKGWLCHHPENNLHVLFESFPLYTLTPNQDPSLLYSLKFQEMRCSGFFYVKWDQNGLDELAPYQNHLEEIRDEILKMVPDQKFVEEITFNKEVGYAILAGYPYGLITVSGDNFLFAFAVKGSSNPHIKYDLNSLINQIKWFND